MEPGPKMAPLPSRRRQRNQRGRRWPQVIFLSLASVGAFAALLIHLFTPESELSPREVANRFLHALKIGSNTVGEGQDAPVGFAHAYSMLTRSEQDRMPVEVFLQECFTRERDLGVIVATDELQQRRDLARGGRVSTFRVIYGSLLSYRQSGQTALILAVTVVREEDEWRIGGFEWAPTDPGLVR